MNPETTGSGFPAKEKLKSRKKIQHVFEHGSAIVQVPFKVVYLFNKPEGNEPAFVRFSVSVPKRSFPRAHDRNRIKRKTREVYRLQKAALLQYGKAKRVGLDMMWIYLGKTELDYPSLYTAASKLIQKTMIAADKKFRV